MLAIFVNFVVIALFLVGKLVDAKGLLDALFEADSRPSLRWLRQMQAQRKIPYIKLGHLVRFDVNEVREALAQRWTVRQR
jgi:hypothetical protein